MGRVSVAKPDVGAIEIAIEIEIGFDTTRHDVTLGREKLDVYRRSIGQVAWVYEKAEVLSGVRRPALDQWLRSSQPILRNIAEGNRKRADADRGP